MSFRDGHTWIQVLDLPMSNYMTWAIKKKKRHLSKPQFTDLENEAEGEIILKSQT